MKNNFWNKKIPTLLGVILIAIGIGVTTFLVQQGRLFSIKASPSQQPKDVRVSNITDNSFTISYTTTDKITGAVNYGSSPSFGQSSLDDRDQQSGSVTNYGIHNITIRNLTPSTKYYFTIISGKDTYMNNSSPFEVTTGTAIQDQPIAQDPMTGKVILPNGNSPNEAIVYLTTNNSQVISTLIKSDGSFILPLNSLRNSDLSSYFLLNNDSVIKLLAYGDGISSNIMLSLSQIHPVPTITLSSDYDFTNNLSPVASTSANIQSFPSFENSSSSSNNSNPQILTPQKDQGFTDQQPEFKGTAQPNNSVEIIIHSNEQIQTTTKTDANGNWTYRPSTSLSPGNHTITIITKDVSGLVKTITQSFIVYAEGTQIQGAAGSPTPTLSPSIKITATSTLTLTPTPIQASISASPTLILTDSPTPTTIILTNPTSSTSLPPTGNPNIITAGVVGLLISLIGGLLFLLAKGNVAL